MCRAKSPQPSSCSSGTAHWPAVWRRARVNRWNSDSRFQRWWPQRRKFTSGCSHVRSGVGRLVWLIDRKLPERLHLSPSTRPIRCSAAVLLSGVRKDDRVVRQRPAGQLSAAETAVPPLREADSSAVPDGGGAHGCIVLFCRRQAGVLAYSAEVLLVVGASGRHDFLRSGGAHPPG